MASRINLTVVLSVVMSASCGKSDGSSVTIEAGTVARVNGCHIALDQILVHPKNDGPLGDFRYVCNVEESALNTKEWWGTQGKPLQFPMFLGDCTRLDKTFYCVEQIDISNATITLKATYKQKHWDGSLLERVR